MSIDLDVYCTCGNLLGSEFNTRTGRIEVEPCGDCLQEAKDKGYEEGEEAGYSRGLEEK